MKIKDLVLKEIKGFWGEEPAENEKGIPVIKTNNLTYEGVINYSDLCYRSIDVNKVKDNFLIKGDLLIEKSGGTKTHSVGYVSYFDGTDNTYVCNNFILGLRINENIVRPKYIFYILKYMYENGYFAHCYKQTTGIQNLKKDLYLDFDIQVPDFQTQDNIINVLDKITTSTTKDQQKLKKYDDLVKSQFIEMFGDVISNPMNWNTKSIVDITDIKGFNGEIEKINNKVWLLNLDMVESQSGQIISKVYVDKNQVGNSTTTFNESYVLYSKLRPYLNKVVLPYTSGYCTTELIPLLPNKEILNKYFLCESLRSESFVRFIQEKVAGAKMPRVQPKIFKEFKLILPPIELQNQFADFVKHIDKLKFTIKQSIEKLELCYKSLMKQYFD